MLDGLRQLNQLSTNGKDLGRMSNKSNPETWLFAPPDPPVQTNRT